MDKETITIATRDFGEITVPKKSVLHFPQGIYAFEKEKSFVLISPLGQNAYPMWLQSTQKEKPCFIVYDPFALAPDFHPLLNEESKQLLSFEEGDELHYLVIAVIPENYKNTTVNLKSPIVINKNKSLAAQVILEQDYTIRYPIFEEKGES